MRLYLFLFFLCFSFLGFSQSDGKASDLKLKKNLSYEKYALGFSPSALANFYSGIQLSHDFGLNPKFNLAFETAYIYSSVYSPYTNGFRLKSGIQYMIVSNEYVGVVLGANHIFRWSHAPREFSVLYFNEEYIEQFKLDRVKSINGIEGTLGLLLKITDRLRMEVGVGLGVGYLNVTDKNSTISRPDSDFFNSNFGFSLENSNSSTIGVGSFNLNLSYVLFKQ